MGSTFFFSKYICLAMFSYLNCVCLIFFYIDGKIGVDKTVQKRSVVIRVQKCKR